MTGEHGEKGAPDLESTGDLLIRIRGGDRHARDVLIRRYMNVLRRMAHGRLPRRARGLLDTDDLVQLTLASALKHMETFEPRREGAFLAWLRQILFNKITDAARQVRTCPEEEPLDDDLPDEHRSSPLQVRIGAEQLEAYEKALGDLSEQQREAVIMRLEMGSTYEQIAVAVDSPSANAARMLITRALIRMAERMRPHRDEQ